MAFKTVPKWILVTLLTENPPDYYTQNPVSFYVTAMTSGEMRGLICRIPFFVKTA